MTITVEELRAALVEAGVDNEKAVAAASAVVSRDQLAILLETIATKADLAELEARLLRWMIGSYGVLVTIVVLVTRYIPPAQ